MHRSMKLIPAIVVLGGVLTGGLITAAAAQDTSPADHPIVGAWMASTPGGPALGVFSSDGTVVMGLPASSSGPMGLVFQSTEVGTWEAIDDHAIHFTAVQLLSDADGALVGSLTFEGDPLVSDDGQTLLDENTSRSGAALVAATLTIYTGISFNLAASPASAAISAAISVPLLAAWRRSMPVIHAEEWGGLRGLTIAQALAPMRSSRPRRPPSRG